MVAAKKYDAGKSPITQGCLQYFPKALAAVGLVSKYGSEKYNVPYSERNWYGLPDGFNRYTDGLGRHLVAEGDYAYDGESHLLHAAHCAWNALARLEILLADGQVPLDDPIGHESVPF